MQLNSLIEHITYESVQGSREPEITDICYHSGSVKKGSLFVCIKGQKVDGHHFIADAIKRGAAALVVEEYIAYPGVPVVWVSDTRAALAELSTAFFDYPAKKLKMIGITGTKGKTTTAFFVAGILREAGYRPGMIGTIWIDDGVQKIPAEHTTPESCDIQRYLHRMVENGCDCCVMEVSSQGIKMQRVQEIWFDIGVFLNIEPDHIGKGEHASFAEYLNCKRRLMQMCDIGIVNQDDANMNRILFGNTCKMIETFSMHLPADIMGESMYDSMDKGKLYSSFEVYRNIDSNYDCNSNRNSDRNLGRNFARSSDGNFGSNSDRNYDRISEWNFNRNFGRDLYRDFDRNPDRNFGRNMEATGTFSIPLPGKFNIYNALAAIAVTMHFDVTPEEICRALQKQNVPGRCENVSPSEKYVVLIDYAHNEMSLKNLLETLRTFHPKRLVVLFGCGGNRSKLRRNKMGETAGLLADVTILTSDNPRWEDPELIIDDIEDGISGTKGAYIRITDRREAVYHVLEHAEEGDLIVISGKGHEAYQEVYGRKYPMKDAEIVAEAVRQLSAENQTAEQNKSNCLEKRNLVSCSSEYGS